jgi:hypothetical protein
VDFAVVLAAAPSFCEPANRKETDVSDLNNDAPNFGQPTGGPAGATTTPMQPVADKPAQDHPDGLIQKVEGVVEQAVEDAIQKVESIVGGAIDTVADAAKRTLGDDGSKRSDP